MNKVANEIFIEQFARKPTPKKQRTNDAGDEMRRILVTADFTRFLRAFDSGTPRWV